MVPVLGWWCYAGVVVLCWGGGAVLVLVLVLVLCWCWWCE
jgi:hypothetical protein